MQKIGIISALLAGMLCLRVAHGKPAKGEGLHGYTVNLAPLNMAVGSLDCKIKVFAQTANGEKFERGITIKGPVTKHTAEDALLALKTLYEFHQWDVKEISKTQFLVIGKNGSPVEKMEIRVEGLDKAFHPVITQVKKK